MDNKWEGAFFWRKTSYELQIFFDQVHVEATEDFITLILFQFTYWTIYICYKQCCGSGSGIRCLFDPWIRDPGSQTNICDNFLGKKFYNSLKIDPNFFLQTSKNKIIYNFVKFVAIRKGIRKGMRKFFFPPLFCYCFWIRDPGWVKSWSGIRDKHPGSATLVIKGIRGIFLHSFRNPTFVLKFFHDNFSVWTTTWSSVRDARDIMRRHPSIK